MRRSYTGPYKATPKAKAVVANFIAKLGQSVVTTPLDGLVVYITGAECSLASPSPEYPGCHRISLAFPDGDGLQNRHLHAALCGDPGGSIRLLVDMLQNAEINGTAFLDAHRDDIGLLLQCFGEAVEQAAHRLRRAH